MRGSRTTEVGETISSYLPVVRSYRIPAHKRIQYLDCFIIIIITQ